MSSSRNNEARIYVGNLPPDIRTKDIEDLFYKFGKIAYIDLKNRRGPPFAFVEFEDPRYVTTFVIVQFVSRLNSLLVFSEMPKMLFIPEMVMIMMGTTWE